jgi:hypothetical protein
MIDQESSISEHLRLFEQLNGVDVSALRKTTVAISEDWPAGDPRRDFAFDVLMACSYITRLRAEVVRLSQQREEDVAEATAVADEARRLLMEACDMGEPTEDDPEEWMARWARLRIAATGGVK